MEWEGFEPHLGVTIEQSPKPAFVHPCHDLKIVKLP